MIRLLLRLLALLIAAFALAVGAIIAQPRDDAAMRAFFAPPEGCASPCFLGLRPGVTSRDDAVDILSAHPWISLIDGGDEGLAWTWNGQQPAFVDRYRSGFLLAHVDFTDGVVSSIHVPTTTRWADFYVLFGKPDRAIAFTVSAPSVHYRIYDAAYFAHGFEVSTSTRCPVTSSESAWYSTIFITWPVSGRVLTDEQSSMREC